VPIYVLLRMGIDHISPKHFFRPAIAVGAAITILIGYIYLRPFVAAKNTYRVYRPVEAITEFSARLPDFLFTPAENLTYGSLGKGRIARALWSNFTLVDPFEHPYEHRLFPGTVAVLFFIAVVWLFLRRKFSVGERHMVVPYGVLLALALILAFGPTIQTGTFSLPSLYQIIYALPFADTLRAPSRFVVMALFALAILAAFVWPRIQKRVRGAAGRRALLFFIIFLLCVEYRYDFGAFTDIPSDVKALYRTLDQMRDIQTIIEVPMVNGTVGSFFIGRSDIEDAIYLYYAIYHHKYLVNGYGGYIPPVFHKIGRSVDSEFPSKEKLAELKKLGVDAVVVHLDEYAYPSYGAVAVQGFQKLGIPEIARTDTIRVYRLY